MLLMAQTFKRCCYIGGKDRHRVNECRLKGNDNSNNHDNQNKKLVYRTCRKNSHKTKHYWNDDRTIHKKLKNFKKKEYQSAVIDIKDLITSIGGMQFPTSMEMLSDPNVWIADTGATCHSTLHQDGLTNLKNN